MPNHRKPTALKLIEGNRGKRELPKSEPQVVIQVPKPPKCLNGLAIEEWQRVCIELYNCGLVSNVDMAVLSAYCQSFARWFEAEQILKEMALNDEVYKGLIVIAANGTLMSNPVVSTASSACKDMIKYASELGMTPAARSKVQAIKQEKQDDPAAKYLG